MENDIYRPTTVLWGATDVNHMLELAGRDDLSTNDDDGEPPNAAFRVPHPEAGGGWVAVLYTQTVAPPSIPGPWRNYGGGIGPKRILWVNGRGEWGYSEHHVAGKDSLYQMNGSLEALRKSIRPVREIEGFEMMPEKYLERALGWNAEEGWPLERLVALARGDFEVDNPAMKYWK
ncbi:hypothetical protein [Meiothermus cerbereus]|uniref:hypothetical protein n=1 Tax=Meiothermus cerbereus TaxID=65552 RepID=UPI003EEE1624